MYKLIMGDMVGRHNAFLFHLKQISKISLAQICICSKLTMDLTVEKMYFAVEAALIFGVTRSFALQATVESNFAVIIQS